jgi:hypothetical protein
MVGSHATTPDAGLDPWDVVALPCSVALVALVVLVAVLRRLEGRVDTLEQVIAGLLASARLRDGERASEEGARAGLGRGSASEEGARDARLGALCQEPSGAVYRTSSAERRHAPRERDSPTHARSRDRWAPEIHRESSGGTARTPSAETRQAGARSSADMRLRSGGAAGRESPHNSGSLRAPLHHTSPRRTSSQGSARGQEQTPRRGADKAGDGRGECVVAPCRAGAPEIHRESSGGTARTPSAETRQAGARSSAADMRLRSGGAAGHASSHISGSLRAPPRRTSPRRTSQESACDQEYGGKTRGGGRQKGALAGATVFEEGNPPTGTVRGSATTSQQVEQVVGKERSSLSHITQGTEAYLSKECIRRECFAKMKLLKDGHLVEELLKAMSASEREDLFCSLGPAARESLRAPSNLCPVTRTRSSGAMPAVSTAAIVEQGRAGVPFAIGPSTLQRASSFESHFGAAH